MTLIEKRFKKRLIDKEMSQKEVADHFGWSSQYLRQLLKGMTAGPAADANLAKVKDYMGLK
ncbi:helix-turn-helix domain-containing protein [Lacticaseibacillus sp. N501-2]|uniref:helix-turn-helix domain-containing protein n=1 Tax=Lacticaseibacillus salsurae TaxID=3367729 RepID=UPI0038B35963